MNESETVVYSSFSFSHMIRWGHFHTDLNYVYERQDWLALAAGESIFCTDAQTADPFGEFPS